MLNQVIRALCVMLLISFNSVAYADEKHEVYTQAKKALRKGNVDEYLSLKEQLQDHHLAPYLDYYHLKKNFSTIDDEKIQAFIDKHPHSPMADKLRHMWLQEFKKNQQWDKYAKTFTSSKKVANQCDYYYSLIMTGHASEAYPKLKDIWLTGRNLPDNCDIVFDNWLNQANDKQELLWARFDLALKKYNFKLAKFLINKMSSKKQSEANAVLRLYKQPYLVNQAGFQAKYSNPEVISYGIFRLARRNPELAIKVWNRLKNKYQFNAKQKQRIFQAIALRFALRKNKKSAIWFRKVIGMHLDPVYQEWMIRSALINRDWRLVKDGIEGMPEKEREKTRWQYWRARALDKLGMKEQAQKAFAKIENNRDYHGFLAQKHNKKSLKVKHQTPQATTDELNQLKQMVAFKRAKSLYQLNHKREARIELYYLLMRLQPKQQHMLMKLVYDWGWKKQALHLSRFAKHQDDINIRFPLAYKDTVKSHAVKRKVPAELVYAIMRQESFFNPKARSHAGAVGLMQLMPKTAYKTSKQFGLKYAGSKDLLNGETNIKFGTAHLRKLHEQLADHPVLVIAAYNAGREAVNRWLPRDQAMPADIWIETIPFYETRKYLRHVIAYYVVYQHRLGKSPSLSNILKAVK